MSDGLPQSMRSGPAAALYEQLVPGTPMRDRWVAEIRRLWGEPQHASLEDFPEVAREEIRRSSLDTAIEVPITLFTPPGAIDDAFVYLHGGGWIAPTAGKHLGWAKRMAALTRRRV